MKITNNISVFVIIISLFVGSCNKSKNILSGSLELPAVITNHQFLVHKAYALSYNEFNEQADWVAYELTKEEASATDASRTDDFRPDGEIVSGSSTPEDYLNSGYDRGHLAPAGDMKMSYDVMSESFFMSNISPQTAGLNRGKWKTLENQVRKWAIEFNTVYIATGPIFSDNLPTIGTNKVSVPNYFYKVILDYDGKKGIGFIMKNETLSGDLSTYATTIDAVEEQTGIDFFWQIPEDQQNQIERTLHLEDWNFSFK